MAKFKFVGDSGEGKKRTKRTASTEGAEFEFVGEAGKFQFVGASSSGTSKREETKKLRGDLGACLVDMAREWEKEPVELDEAKQQVLACVEQAESEGGKPVEWRRMKLIISQIEEFDELVKYIYNYCLRASGLSVSTVMGRRE